MSTQETIAMAGRFLRDLAEHLEDSGMPGKAGDCTATAKRLEAIAVPEPKVSYEEFMRAAEVIGLTTAQAEAMLAAERAKTDGAAPEPKAPRYTVREDGEANHWSIMYGEPNSPPSRWVMVVKLNGEMMDAKQRAIMQRISDLLNQHGEG